MNDMSAAPNLTLPLDHPKIAHGKVGILLVNLGSPDAPTTSAVRRFLGEMLSDRRIIELSPWIWQPILRSVVLTTRPQRTRHAYAAIWDQDANDSPIRVISYELADKLQAGLTDLEGVHIRVAMRYGNPSIRSQLEALRETGCDRLMVYAMYPQYSATTVATIHDVVFDALKEMRWQPALRTVPSFHDHDDYIQPLARSIQGHIGALGWEPEKLLCSFHGLPKSYFEKGDPYHCHCAKTTRLLTKALGWPASKVQLTFQSRFGPREWLQPYTEATVIELAKSGVKKLAIATPSFMVDCLETLEEVGMGLKETFEAHGGTHFAALPCLNASDEGVEVSQTVLARELAGWLAPA